jgi:hypothetical protein
MNGYLVKANKIASIIQNTISAREKKKYQDIYSNFLAHNHKHPTTPTLTTTFPMKLSLVHQYGGGKAVLMLC